MVRSLYEITECTQCASQNIIHNAKSMQIICKDCGLIYDPFKPVKNVGLIVTTAPNNSERIIRPVEKPVQKRTSAAKRPKAAKPKKPVIKKKPAKKKPIKKTVKIAKKTNKSASKRSIGGKIKGFVNKLMKKKRR